MKLLSLSILIFFTLSCSKSSVSTAAKKRDLKGTTVQSQDQQATQDSYPDQQEQYYDYNEEVEVRDQAGNLEDEHCRLGYEVINGELVECVKSEQGVGYNLHDIESAGDMAFENRNQELIAEDKEYMEEKWAKEERKTAKKLAKAQERQEQIVRKEQESKAQEIEDARKDQEKEVEKAAKQARKEEKRELKKANKLAKKQAQEAEDKIQAQEKLVKKQAQEAQDKVQAQEKLVKKQAQEEANKKRAQEKLVKKQAQEAQDKVQAQEKLVKKQAQAAAKKTAARKQAQEEDARKQAELDDNVVGDTPQEDYTTDDGGSKEDDNSDLKGYKETVSVNMSYESVFGECALSESLNHGERIFNGGFLTETDIFEGQMDASEGSRLTTVNGLKVRMEKTNDKLVNPRIETEHLMISFTKNGQAASVLGVSSLSPAAGVSYSQSSPKRFADSYIDYVNTTYTIDQTGESYDILTAYERAEVLSLLLIKKNSQGVEIGRACLVDAGYSEVIGQ